MKCAVEHDLFIKETKEHEREERLAIMEQAYEAAFEHASVCSDEETWQYFGRRFKNYLEDEGLTTEEIYECIDWLSEDKRMEWE